MNRYIIIATGLLIGLNDLRMLIDAHWVVVNNTWEIVDFTIMALLVLAALINRKNFYAVTLLVCVLVFLLAAVGFYNIYFRRDYPLTVFAFARPALLLIALYGLLKSINQADKVISN